MQHLHLNKVKEWHAAGYDKDQILEQLQSGGLPFEEAEQLYAAVKKEIQMKSRSIGMILIMIGAALCFFSMVYTFFFGHSYFMLYGITLVGVTVAFAGLVYVMG